MDAVVELGSDLRSELKEPLGPVYTDADGLLAEAGSPLVAVGDVVTYHLLEAGRVPDVALVDARTERERVDPEVLARLEAGDFDRERSVENPAAVLTADLLAALRAAVGSEGTVCLDIDGEEDLATLPAVALAADGASVVYGQPGEGMVHVVVDDEVRASARELLGRFEGDTDRLFELLGL